MEKHRTKEQLINELAEMRQRIAELEALEAEHKPVEEALRESEEKYRTILENIEDGYYEVDIAGNMTFFNDSLCRLYGYSEHELMGMNYRQYMDDETAKAVYQTYNTVYGTGKPTETFDWEVIRKDGARRFVQVSVSLMRGSTGEPVGFRGIIRDITERKQAEEALRKAHDELEIRVDERTAELAEANKELQAEIAERKQAEEALRKAHDELEIRVEERTAELAEANKELQAEIAERKRAEEALQQREAVLGAMALAAEKFLRPSDWEQDMQAALAYLGKAVDAIRVIIWEASTSEDGKYLISGRYEWLVPEAKLAPMRGLQNVPVFRRWRDLLPRGEIVTGHVRDFSAKEQEFFVPRGINSVLAVPIFVHDAWWGFMGFDQGETGREWTEAEIDALKTAASMFGGALEHKAADEALKEYSERLEEMVEERTKELQDAQEQLVRREKLAVLGQLAGGVGHELRNPLGAIKNAAYFLNMVLEEPEPEVKETLEILEKEVATSERTISSLLDFARAKPPIWRKMDINEVVQEALSRAAMTENVEVVSQLDGTLPAILADPDQLGQVFGSIILNSVQAMPEGGQLTIKSEVPSPEWVAIFFTDTGVGISEESLGQLFEPLFTTKAKGIGLGLAVAKTLVEGHGGRIEVESEVGVGTTFTVRLPISVG